MTVTDLPVLVAELEPRPRRLHATQCRGSRGTQRHTRARTCGGKQSAVAHVTGRPLHAVGRWMSQPGAFACHSSSNEGAPDRRYSALL